MNDSIVLWLLNLYQKTTSNGFLDHEHGSHDGIHLYIIDNKGYLLFS
jgi:hypothetical protein